MNDLNPNPWPDGTLPAPEWCEDCDRLTVLAGFGVERLRDDPELSEITRFAAELCAAPIALVSIVEEHRQNFIAGLGLEVTETPREYSFCAHAMMGQGAMVIPDATVDPSFADNPLVTGDPHVRFYAGMPLVTSEGAPIGALCIIDTQPRPEGLSATQMRGLSVLARSVMRRLESQRQSSRSAIATDENARRLRFMLDSVPDIAWSALPGPVFDRFNARWDEVTGAAPPRSVSDWERFIHPDDWDASREKFTAAVEAVEPFEDQLRIRQADGTYRWNLSRAVPSHADAETAQWFGTLTDIDVSHRQSESRDLIARELAHRIKNIFAVMNGLIALRSRGKPEVRDFADELAGTVRALGRAQEFVRPLTDEKGESLRGLLDILTAPYGKGDGRHIHVTGDRVEIGIRAATPMALVFHELATNSAKYGALSAEQGSVEVALRKDATSVHITWAEHGGPEVSAPSDSGFGSRLLRMSIESQLDGSLDQEWDANGLRVRITLPLASLAN
ncbi:sensor histidine kinase [Parerythrobacter jejuensis]|uniref:histidine kinase n=1 Tax=Parerythrobacter jejuensis TaxID=795812 RepID=A0A845ARQ1_9SPHN|nr:GAF domain-containing protein [Parerythrobacter jejuensis]MXP31186.1 PAS domain-containing protein [Parerythrobacter jejuensis]MXP33946.1 PAS domain-containing protein [Parerythrobacter jejuensis]